MILILGASGYIGNYLFERLKRQGLDVIGTYFKNKKEGMLYFDLERTRLDELGLDAQKTGYVIISAAANTKIDNSKIHWDNSRYLNVEKIKGVIDYCFQNGIVPIYISTDNVFDGRKGRYSETDQRNPVNCYGRIKYEVEDYLLASDKPFIILRVGKVFGVRIKDNTLITEMLETLAAKKKMRLAVDQLFTPVYIEELADFIQSAISGNYRGIFHLASTKPTTRHAIALAIQKRFNLEANNVIACQIDSLGLLDQRPKLIDLDISKYKKLTGCQEKDIEHYLNLIDWKGN